MYRYAYFRQQLKDWTQKTAARVSLERLIIHSHHSFSGFSGWVAGRSVAASTLGLLFCINSMKGSWT